MAKQCRAEWSRNKADGIDAERLQRADQRVGGREIQLGEDQRCNQHVKQEIVGLDYGADGAGDYGAAQLHAVFGIGKIGASSHGGHQALSRSAMLLSAVEWPRHFRAVSYSRVR